MILAGEPGIGKSWLMRNVVGRTLGPLRIHTADGSEAAVARATNLSSLPVIIDEANPSPQLVTGLLKLLRIAAGAEGVRMRADGTSTGVSVQAPRFSALLAAKTIPDLDAADSSRISILRLGPAVPNWPKVKAAILKAVEAAPAIRSRIIRATADLVRTADKITARLEDEGKVTSREAVSAGALTAGWWFWHETPPLDQIVMPYATKEDVSDSKDALLELLTIRVRDSKAQDISLAQAVVSSAESDRERVSDLYGCRFVADRGLMVYPHHKGLKKALQRTALAGADLRHLLSQIDGCQYQKHPVRFHTFKHRCLVFSPEVLENNGIALDEDLPPF